MVPIVFVMLVLRRGSGPRVSDTGFRSRDHQGVSARSAKNAIPLRAGLASLSEGSRHPGMAAYVESIRRAPRTLTVREQKALLRVTGEHRAGWRDHVLFAMALGTGLRAHELVALDVGDVFDGGRVRRRLALRVFKGDGRGDDDGQEVLLPEGLRAKLEKLRTWKADEGESLDRAAPLFVSQRGTRLSTRQLRHAFAVFVTTMVYTHPSDDDLARAVEQLRC